MRFLVTGGGGFLGKAVATRLINDGHDVNSFSRGDYPELKSLGVKCFKGDLTEYGALKKAMSGCDGIFHVAGKAGVWGSYDEYFQANVKGTENVLRGCQELGIKYLVHTSSPSVVFDGTDQEGLDEKAPFAKSYLSHYPSTKAMAEKLVLAANSVDLSTVALRPHLIWGPGDNHIAPRLLKMGRNGRLRLIGKEDKLVDTIYIDNAVDAHILAMEGLMKEEPISGKAYFITNQEPILASKFVNGILKAGKVPEITKRIPANIAYGVGAVCEMVYKVMGIKSDPPMTRFVARQLSTAHWYDTKAAKQELGYIAKVSIDEGFKRLGKSLGPYS